MSRTATGRAVAALLLAAALAACSDAPSSAAAPADVAADRQAVRGPKPAVVLVHGAWADGTGWAPVVRALQRKGYAVTAVQNALQSAAGDIETTRRVVDAQEGPVVLVGHSYGGVSITGAAAGSAKVKALVYVAAFVPEAGEVLGELVGRLGPSSLQAALRPDAAGYLYIDRAQFREVFAGDLPRAEADAFAAAQKPVNGHIFVETIPAAAWSSIPSWYLVARHDNTIKPELQRFMAARAGARAREFGASHLVYVSHPEVVVRLIEDAAAATD